MLELRSIGKRYGKTHVLSELSHQFAPSITVITGPSGAGKSTLLRLCATVEKPSEGQVLWNEAPLRNTIRGALGYAPQRIDFPEDLTGLDFLIHVAALKRLQLGPAKVQASALLDRLGLKRDAGTLIAAYSGGMRRRLGLAQAFLGAPELLVLDEPTAELDSVTAGHVNDLIFDHADTAVVLMTTHLESGLTGRAYKQLEIRPST
jgi:ABC-2 type transport system ATP-binding protein